ncbi:MAG TPA: glycosyltransferase family 1 protein [Pseudomonas xinjiangensis]|uniref:Glycosyltransferase family 1 protein n=2 Tax=root TaxID=1 RepID=A0A7V1FS38_9GAMM|nr:glycosyltransferase family 1 protein [Halopseudomonas xinjiangensis]HEC49497.1 glycosyltransferase family 1 protein [Halopseudomonas xinjiangensis]
MKVLFLVQKEQRAILDALYEAVAANCECDTRRLTDSQQADLQTYFAEEVDVCAYDRIVLFLRFKKEIRQVAFIRSLPNLVILEHDAYQNYISGKYQGRFSRHYRRLPWVRIISSGHTVSHQLREEGFDAVFVPKGYDQRILEDLGHVRDIELAFVGSTKHKAYVKRKELLEELASVENLSVTRTHSGQDYLTTLNRIRFFVSADVGMGEYMIKNFEAMACGCVLLAYDQGSAENDALGLEDMGNVVLYKDVAQLRQKLAVLRADPSAASQIAERGRDLACDRYGFDRIGAEIVRALEKPLRPRQELGWFENIYAKMGL